ncbi:MAG: hypothetical protein QM731_27715 [Chitinophagaceae bacterium]
MLRNTLLILLCIIGLRGFSQTISGSWYGKADVVAQGNNNNYLTELVLKQKGDKVEGIFGYYFKDSYQSFYIRGKYDKNTREIKINNIPLIFYGSTSTRAGIDCPMTFTGILTVNKIQSSIKGSFLTSESKYKYTCPEIRVNMLFDIAENKDSILSHHVAGQKIWKPSEDDFVVINTADHKAVTVMGDNSKPLPERVNSVNIEINPLKDLIDRFEKRKNVYTKDIEIEADSVRISFYDNGEIDGDTISVFMNKQPIIVSQGLTTKAVNLYFALDTLQEVNELSMFAENLGKYPPNTALMVITDGIHRYEVYMSSSLLQNATVRLKRKKKH